MLLSLIAIRHKMTWLVISEWRKSEIPLMLSTLAKCFASAKRIWSGCTENRLCVHEFWNGQTGEIALIHIHKEKCSAGITAVRPDTALRDVHSDKYFSKNHHLKMRCWMWHMNKWWSLKHKVSPDHRIRSHAFKNYKWIEGREGGREGEEYYFTAYPVNLSQRWRSKQGCRDPYAGKTWPCHF